MKVPEQFRVRTGPMASDESWGNTGFFVLPSNPDKGLRPTDVIASDGSGWERVSAKIRVGKYTYTPTWDEMCRVKQLFWDDEECVMQLHPRKSEEVNFHENVLHLWKPVISYQDRILMRAFREKFGGGCPIPEPPSELVGPKTSHIER